MSDRELRIRELLGVRGHLDGCPGEDDPEATRAEAYELMRPKFETTYNGGDPITTIRRLPVTVVRCIDCGGQRTYESPLEELLTTRPKGGLR